MIGLEKLDASYVIISSSKVDDISSILYAKEYKLLQIKEFHRNRFSNAIIAFGNSDNDLLRKDVLFLLDHFDENNAIVKYLGDQNAKRVFKDGSESLLSVIMYNTNEENISYLYNGFSFSFEDQVRYWCPNKKEDFKKGMIVEYLSNNKWLQRKVENPDSEYDKMYNLLIKYNKIRIASI